MATSVVYFREPVYDPKQKGQQHCSQVVGDERTQLSRDATGVYIRRLQDDGEVCENFVFAERVRQCVNVPTEGSIVDDARPRVKGR